MPGVRHAAGADSRAPAEQHGATPTTAGRRRRRQRYFCPMKCEGEKTYDKPGNCPVCNMKLEKAASPAPPDRPAVPGLLAVPVGAVLDSGTRRIVYVEKGRGTFEPREVTLGPRCGEFFPVLEGAGRGRAGGDARRVPHRQPVPDHGTPEPVLPRRSAWAARRPPAWGAGTAPGSSRQRTTNARRTAGPACRRSQALDGRGHDMVNAVIRWCLKNTFLMLLLIAGAVRRGLLRHRAHAGRRDPGHRREAGHRLGRLARPQPAGRGRPGHLPAHDEPDGHARREGHPLDVGLRLLDGLRHLQGRGRLLLGPLARAGADERRPAASARGRRARARARTPPPWARSSGTRSRARASTWPSCARSRTGTSATSSTSVEGVTEVASIGGFVKQYQIDVDPDKMRAHRVTLLDVYEAVRKSNIDVGAKVDREQRRRVLHPRRGLHQDRRGPGEDRHPPGRRHAALRQERGHGADWGRTSGAARWTRTASRRSAAWCSCATARTRSR